MPLAFAPAPLDDGLAAGYRESGLHTDIRIGALLERNRTELGGRPAVIEGPISLTWRELADAASAFAGFLTAQGIGPGDVVLWQLPNWWECLVVGLGTWAAGAIGTPVVTIYRQHELVTFLDLLRPRCVVTSATFRGCEHTDLFEDSLAASACDPPVRVVVRGAAAGWVTVEDALRAAPSVRAHVDPDAPALVVLTSGTTSGSKAVVHSTRTALTTSLANVRVQGRTSVDRVYVTAPMSHVGGLISAFFNPLLHGSSVLLRDRWDPQQAVTDIAENGVTAMGGGVVFARELLAAIRGRGLDRLSLRNGFLCGSTTMPEVVLEELEAVGARPSRSYGMSECPYVSGAYEGDPTPVRFSTDGRAFPGVEVRAVDAGGAQVGLGREGELLVRGPQRALGYVDADHTVEGFTDGGWFRSGDLGVVGHDGTVTVTGRVKDIVNRGGEKLSAREIEDVLARHPAVLEAAVIAVPDERLGEQPAAVVQLRPGLAGTGVSGDDLARFLREQRMAVQKVPRVWHFADELPRTPNGKVKKFELVATYVRR